uniref:hypothetical protein n=1 Tax=Nocardia abscessus TaxID=120957 RepID=UPI002458A795
NTITHTHSPAGAMPRGPTEPATRSHHQFPRRPWRAAAETPGPSACAVPALLLFVTVVQYPV